MSKSIFTDTRKTPELGFLPVVENTLSQIRTVFGLNNLCCGPGSFIVAALISEQIGVPINAVFCDQPRKGKINMIFGSRTTDYTYMDHVWLEIWEGENVFVCNPGASLTDPDVNFEVDIVPFQKIESYRVDAGLSMFEDPYDLSFESMVLVFQLVDRINEGSIPEMYMPWYKAVMDNINCLNE